MSIKSIGYIESQESIAIAIDFEALVVRRHDYKHTHIHC
jgi:hypothetical protein